MSLEWNDENLVGLARNINQDRLGYAAHTHKKKSQIFNGLTQINFSCQQHVNTGWQSNYALHSHLGTQTNVVLFQHMW